VDNYDLNLNRNDFVKGIPELNEECFDILEGAIDFHLHPGPSISRRRVDIFEAARDAYRVGMKALVYKPLYFATMSDAYAAQKMVPGIKVFGGVVLDQIAGGLRPATVEVAIKMHAKVIWMPLFDSTQTRKSADAVPFYKSRFFGNDILTIFDANKKIKDEVFEILDLIASSPGVILSTSHLTPSESLAIIKAAKERGVEKIVVTHPTANIIGASIKEQVEMSKLGAYINHCFGYILPKPTGAGQNPVLVAEAIKAVGADRCILSSDMGIWYSSTPVEGLRSYVEILMQCGISRKEIDLMIKKNPSEILGLS